MTLKLREGWEVMGGRWGLRLIGSAEVGWLVVYDVTGECVRLYDTAGEYLYALDVTVENWEQVAHAYLVKHKLVSPWEVTE